MTTFYGATGAVSDEARPCQLRHAGAEDCPWWQGRLRQRAPRQDRTGP